MCDSGAGLDAVCVSPGRSLQPAPIVNSSAELELKLPMVVTFTKAIVPSRVHCRLGPGSGTRRGTSEVATMRKASMATQLMLFQFQTEMNWKPAPAFFPL